MRSRCVLFGLLVALSACGSSAAESTKSGGSTGSTATSTPTGAPAAKVPCGPPQARTLAASSVARAYAASGIAYGCSSGGKKQIRLGEIRAHPGAPRVGPVVVAGYLAAYGLQRSGVDTGSGSVQVQRLSDGQMLQSVPATVTKLGPESYQSVAAIVLKPDGAVAWIGTGMSIIHRRQAVEVHKVDRHGSRMLDHGTGIGERSLRLHGSTVTWSHGGRTRSATLR